MIFFPRITSLIIVNLRLSYHIGKSYSKDHLRKKEVQPLNRNTKALKYKMTYAMNEDRNVNSIKMGKFIFFFQGDYLYHDHVT